MIQSPPDCLTDEIVRYAARVATEVAQAIEGQIAAGVARLLDEPGRGVRIAVTVSLATDETGGLIAPELSVRRTESSEKKALTPFRIQLEMLFPDSGETTR